MPIPVPASIGRYKVLGLIGQGAMGIVYKGLDDTLDREVALKVMSASSVGDPESRARFVREGKAVARLQHPNIVTIYELGEFQGGLFMAMELLEGIDLQHAITQGLRPNPRATLPIVLHVLSGLAHAHEHGIVHRDIKPSNVFLPRARGAKIMDFGVARLGGSGMTQSGAIMGTPNYMSPEQVHGAALDGRSDLFSTGLILYELVTGEKAYQGDNPVSLMFKIAQGPPDLSLIPSQGPWQRLHAVVQCALAHKPDDRYPDAHAFEAELQAALADLGGDEPAAGIDRALMFRTDRRASAPASSPPAAARFDTNTESEGPPAVPAEVAWAEQPMHAPPAAPADPWRDDSSSVARRRSTVHRPRPAAGVAEPVSRAPMVVAIVGLAALVVAGVLVLRHVLAPPAVAPSPASVATVAPAPATPVPATPVPTATAKTKAPPITSQAAPPPTTPATPAPLTTPPPGSLAEAPPATVRSASPPAPPAEDQVAPGGGRMDRANALFERGNYQAAMAEARAVLRREPGNREAQTLLEDAEAASVVENHLHAARDLMRKGDNAGALEHVRAGLVVAPSDSRLLSLFRELNQ